MRDRSIKKTNISIIVQKTESQNYAIYPLLQINPPKMSEITSHLKSLFGKTHVMSGKLIYRKLDKVLAMVDKHPWQKD